MALISHEEIGPESAASASLLIEGPGHEVEAEPGQSFFGRTPLNPAEAVGRDPPQVSAGHGTTSSPWWPRRVPGPGAREPSPISLCALPQDRAGLQPVRPVAAILR